MESSEKSQEASPRETTGIFNSACAEKNPEFPLDEREPGLELFI